LGGGGGLDGAFSNRVFVQKTLVKENLLSRTGNNARGQKTGGEDKILQVSPLSEPPFNQRFFSGKVGNRSEGGMSETSIQNFTKE